MFDPNTFLNTTIEDGNATQLLPIPTNAEVGDDQGYPATIDPIKPENFRDNSAHEPGTAWMDFYLTIHDTRVAEKTKRDKNRVRGSVYLELTPQGGIALGEGVNVGLGRLREVVGQNEKGRKWGLAMLANQAVRVFVKHRYGKDGSGPYAEVDKIVAA